MGVSAIRVQDKDTGRKLSVVESTECPGKYGLVLVNPDGSRISGPKGDPGPAGPSICSAEFNGDDIDFGRSDGCTVKLEDAKICLQGPSGNGICCTTCTKNGKTTKIQFDYTNGNDFCFCVQDGQDGQGSGDMLKCVYDPNNCEKNVFDYNNLDNKPSIPTDNCQLGNGCGYTTCMGTLVPSDLNNYAKCCDIPTDNCQLGNSCGYATCNYVNDSINSVTAYYITKDAQGGQFATYAELSTATTFYSGGQVRVPTKNDYTIVLADENHDNATTRYLYNNSWEYQYTVNETALTQAQLDAINSGITCSKVSCYDNCMAQCCDIPTNNCQLSNGCGYTTCTGTVSSCSDIINRLGYTPYNSTNPSGYTSCTGTLVPSDLNNYAKCCDIPDVSEFVEESCIATINGCCLTSGGDICIQGGIQNDTTGTTTTVTKIWAGTEAEFALITPTSGVEYHVYPN